MHDTKRQPNVTATQLDAQDTIGHLVQDFYLPAGRVFLDGNSLGPLSKRSEASLWRVLESWKTQGIGGWLDGNPAWFTLAEHLAEQMAPLVGAQPHEVIVANSTTVNLHQLLATLYLPQNHRSKILVDALNFPSDRYAVESHLRLRGRNPVADLVVVESQDGWTLDESAIIDAMTDDVALAVLPSVVYRSGQLLDLERLAAEAQARGIVVGFDLSHSVGVVRHQLSAWGADFAFWCTYKYLNGGPGAVGSLFLHTRHRDRAPGLAGWFGCRKERQFAMSSSFTPAEGAGGLQIGTPPILSMAPLLGSLELIREAGIDAIRRKSLALNAYLRSRIETELAEFGFVFATPHDDSRRGGHLALVHPEASRICKALIAQGVIPDHRPPDIVRLAPVPLYTRFADCDLAVAKLKEIMVHKHYLDYPTERGLIT